MEKEKGEKKMSAVARRYKTLSARLIMGRDGGSLTEEHEDEMLDELDDLWLGLSAEERALLDA